MPDTHDPHIENLTSSEFEVRKRQPKILLFDIETAPLRIRAWRRWQTDAITVDADWYMLSWSAKWLGGKHVTKALCDYDGYDPLIENDKALVTDLAALFNEADIIIGHNGDRFDIKKTNTRLIVHGIAPPPPTKTVDTLKIAKRYFAFTSNKLDEICKALGIGRKAQTGGFELWDGCITGNTKAWAKMKRYNRQDVVLLEKLYLRLRPWIQTHPNIGVITDTENVCKVCGGSNLIRKGWNYGVTGKSQRWCCTSCGHYQRGPFRKTTDIR